MRAVAVHLGRPSRGRGQRHPGKVAAKGRLAGHVERSRGTTSARGESGDELLLEDFWLAFGIFTDAASEIAPRLGYLVQVRRGDDD